jgi:predicted MFS family arabinose efflux permease
MARKWWTLLAVCTGVFMLLLDITIVNVALPYIQQAFHASLADLQWVIDAYALTLRRSCSPPGRSLTSPAAGSCSRSES